MPALLSRLPLPPYGLRKAVGIATVATQAGIGVTGSVVRVTDSGLACPTWPQCHDGTMFPMRESEYALFNQWVEFGNRLLVILVVLTAAAALLTALRIRSERPERRRPMYFAGGIVFGVLAQAAIGGLTVLAELVWWMVATHFLASTVLVWIAVLLLHALLEGDQRPRWHLGQRSPRLLAGLGALLAAVLVSGTVVTGAGPHAGDPDTERLDAPIEVLAGVHSTVLVGYLLLLAGIGALARRAGAPRGWWRRYGVIWALALAQALLGVVQYALGVPEALVSLHVLGSFAVLIATAALWCAARDRGPDPSLPHGPHDRGPQERGPQAGSAARAGFTVDAAGR